MENCESRFTTDGHLIGMLDRDQRTAKCPIDRHVCCRCYFNVSIRSIIGQKVVCRARGTWKFSYVHKTLQNLKLVLIFLLYVASLLPCTQSAPTSRNMEVQRRMLTAPKWINPCGMTGESTNVQDNATGSILSDAELITQINAQAGVAFIKADRFKEDYAQKVFGNTFQQVHQLWRGNHYQWLPDSVEIPKNLGERVPEDVLATVKFEESLASIYTSLQKIAVGLEQVVWDQEDLHGPFLKNFSQAEQTLRLVLCEIQMALYEKSVPMNADVQRDIMTKEFRNMADDTSRNLRDFLIYRDFMNALEYSQQVFEYLKSNL